MLRNKQGLWPEREKCGGIRPAECRTLGVSVFGSVFKRLSVIFDCPTIILGTVGVAIGGGNDCYDCRMHRECSSMQVVRREGQERRGAEVLTSHGEALE